MYCLTNQKISFELSETFDFAVLTDLSSRETYRCDGVFQFVYGNYYSYSLPEQCRTTVQCEENHLSIKFEHPEFFARFRSNGYHKPEPGPDLEFNIHFSLEDRHLVIRLDPIGNMNEEECKLIVAQNFFSFASDQETRLFWPYGFGVEFAFPREDLLQRHYEGGWGYTFPVFGFYRETGGLGLYIKDAADSTADLFINSRQLNHSGFECALSFEKQLANYPRELRILLLPANSDWRTLAREYRKIVKAEGRFRSLAEKIAADPEVGKLPGSVIWKHNTYSTSRPEGVEKGYSLYMMAPDQNPCEQLPNNWTAKEIFDTANANGFDRVCVLNTGWNYDGFDSGYPTRLPPNPERGTVEEFKQAAEYARSLSLDYIYSVHDNYMDSYANSPEFDPDDHVRNIDNSRAKGGIWRGGRSYFLCSAQTLKFARRDLPKIADMVGRGCIYLDVIGTLERYRCYHPDHPQSRVDDIASRKKVFAEAKKAFGAVATEGVPCDCFADVVDLGAYTPVHYLDGMPQTMPQPIPVPFWQMVYHDSVLNYCSESTYKFCGSEYQLLQAAYCMLPTQFDAHSKRLSYELRDAYCAAMTDFEFLIEPVVSKNASQCYETTTVTRSVFSDGTTVIANFLNREFQWQNHRIPPRDFLIIRGENHV